MKRATFQTLARRAFDRLPKQFRDHLEHVEFVIQDWPGEELLRSLDLDPEEDTLLGFYDGVPVGERSHTSDLPEPVTDTIYLFQGALEEACDTEAELVEEIRVTLLHEIGHHFGLDDDEIEKLGYGEPDESSQLIRRVLSPRSYAENHGVARRHCFSLG